MIETDPLSWMHDGLCTEIGGDLWFPEPGSNSNQAIKICNRCPVQQECLEYGLQGNFDGIYGGLTAKQRRAIRMKGAAFGT